MIYEFLGFELDDRLFELRYHEQVVPIQPRVFGLISYLLTHRNRVVSKEELTHELWRAAVASDTAISQVVMLARRALRDEGSQQAIIRTVRARGFRFVADVRSCESTPQAEEPAPTPVARPTSRPQRQQGLIGRAHELRLLDEALRRLDQTKGGLALIEGEPGIGKTTLANALAEEANARGLDVHWGRAWESGGAPPYWPWIQILRSICRREGLAAVRRFMGTAEPEITSLVPEWSDGRPLSPPDISNSHMRFRFFDALARFLRSACAAEETPAHEPARARARVIIIDDLHAVDSASIELLRFLAFELRDMALIVVATTRNIELVKSPELRQLAESIDGEQRILLSGLARNEVSKLVELLLGDAPGAHVTELLYEFSGGNPLLLCEVCRQRGPSGLGEALLPSALSVMTFPERVASTVRLQLDNLSPITHQALMTASALGREFSTRLLASVCKQTEPELLEQLAPAFERGLLRPSTDSSDHLVFSHAMVCNAVYAELSATARLELHRRIAQTLEQTLSPERQPLFEIAHHYLLAAADGCREQAREYARRAADHAFKMTAFEVAAGLYERALQLGETERLPLRALHELACNAAHAWYLAGRLGLAIDRYDQAAALARLAESPELYAEAVLGATSTLRLDLWHNRTRQQQLLEALAMLPLEDSALRANVLAASALGLRSMEKSNDREEATRAAVAMARRVGDDMTLLRTLSAQHVALWGVAHPRGMLVIAEEMVALGYKLNTPDLLLDAMLCRLTNHAELGMSEALLNNLVEYTTQTELRGSPWHAYMATALQAGDAASRGDFERAERLSEHALQQGLRVNDALADVSHAVRSLFLELDRGVRHLPHDQTHRDAPEQVPADYRLCWALLWARTGALTKAAHAVNQLLSHDLALPAVDSIHRPILAVAGLICIELQDKKRLESIYRRLLPSSDLWLVLPAGVGLGPVAYYLGVVAFALDRPEAAEEHLAQAANQAIIRPSFDGPWLVRTQLAYGTVLHAKGDPRGQALVECAEQAATRFGMIDLQREARAAIDGIAHS
jgi:DNA-binding winged helix-turn-helix (wHTH) protein/tetratricopeptide (TPR) repeat protein